LLAQSLGLAREIRNLVNYNYDETFSRARRYVSIQLFRAGDRGPTMSNDPRRPAQRPSNSPPEPADDPPAPRPGDGQFGEQETRPVKQWQAPLPPPPVPGRPPGQPDERRRDDQATRRDPQARPQDQDQTQWAQPPQGGQQGGWQQPPQGGQQGGWQQPQQGAQQGGWQQPPGQWQQPQDQRTRQLPPDQGGPGGPGGPSGPWPPAPPQQQGPGPKLRRNGKRRRRGWVITLFTVLVLVVLLVIGDRVACAVAENEFASQFQKQGLPVKPSVDIEGFPFITQLAAKDFKSVNISMGNVPAGPVTIQSIKAHIEGLHISSFSSNATAKVDHVTATAFIPFTALAAAGGLPGGITLKQDGPNKVKITAGLGGIVSDTEEAQITQTGPQTISIKLIDSGSGLGSILGDAGFNSFSFTLPKEVPASLRITSLNLNATGLNVTAEATNATFSQ
jgi:hypothetical protein